LPLHHTQLVLNRPTTDRVIFPLTFGGVGHPQLEFFGVSGHPRHPATAVWCLHTRCEMRHFYTLRCPTPYWLIQCKPYRNRFITAKVIDKSLGARFYGPLCMCSLISNRIKAKNLWKGRYDTWTDPRSRLRRSGCCKKCPISKSISSVSIHDIKRLTVNSDTSRQNLNFDVFSMMLHDMLRVVMDNYEQLTGILRDYGLLRVTTESYNSSKLSRCIVTTCLRVITISLLRVNIGSYLRVLAIFLAKVHIKIRQIYIIIWQITETTWNMRERETDCRLTSYVNNF